MDVREKLVELIGSTEYGNGSLVGNNFQKGFIEKIATHLIANGVTVQEWISVADKIPPDQEEVLVLTQSKNGVRNVDKGYWAIDHFIHRGRSQVTHWMPLPETPKGE